MREIRAADRCPRRNRDDAAAGRHVRKHLLHRTEDAEQVDVEHQLEIALADLLEAARLIDSGDADQRRDLGICRHRRGDGGAIPHIRDMDGDAIRAGCELPGRNAVPVGDRDVEPVIGKALHGCQSDSRGTSGNECNGARHPMPPSRPLPTTCRCRRSRRRSCRRPSGRSRSARPRRRACRSTIRLRDRAS